MIFHKRYTFTERNENGRLIATGEYSTPEEFDRDTAQNPPLAGHVLTLCDSFTPLDPFGLCHKIVRQVVGS